MLEIIGCAAVVTLLIFALAGASLGCCYVAFEMDKPLLSLLLGAILVFMAITGGLLLEQHSRGDQTINEGTLVGKEYTPAHWVMAGKTMIYIPDSWQVDIVAGKTERRADVGREMYEGAEVGKRFSLEAGVLK